MRARIAGEVLVAHRAEHRVGARKEAHLVEVLRQRGDRVRVVGDVEHQRRLARHDLEAPGQLDQRQPLRTACALIGSRSRSASNAASTPAALSSWLAPRSAG